MMRCAELALAGIALILTGCEEKPLPATQAADGTQLYELARS